MKLIIYCYLCHGGVTIAKSLALAMHSLLEWRVMAFEHRSVGVDSVKV